MIELFNNPKYDFLGKKNYFLAFSAILSLAAVFSFFVKGFNLGIDFSGGTLLNVRFKTAADDSRLRNALAAKGMDITKVIIQPIGSQIGETKNEVLIRMPQTSTNEKAAGGIDADKLVIMEALNDGYSDIPPDIRRNKLDVNNNSRDGIKSRLLEIDALGYKQSMGEDGAEKEYEKITARITDFRDKERGGLIGDISEIPLEGLPAQLGDALRANFYAGDFNIVNAEIVGPQVGNDLRNRAVYVTLAALFGMLLYIAYRFEWIYGVAAVAAVFHDVLVTLFFFSLFEWEISLNVLASLLSLIGFSMNDTIVIFDRIREKLMKTRAVDIIKLSNDAINETLSRTIITSGLTFFSVFALLLFGGPVLRGFSLALFIGIIVGSYSTIAIATPIMLWGNKLAAKRAVKASTANNKKNEEKA